MITGAHIIIYSTDPEADRTFFANVLKFPSVDVGGGWLIFALPPSEVAMHPADNYGRHEFYLMCDDVVDMLRASKIPCSHIHEESWGLLTELTLPSGGKLGIYQPKHERPPQMSAHRQPHGTVRHASGSV
jgi:hypothetical protein